MPVKEPQIHTDIVNIRKNPRRTQNRRGYSFSARHPCSHPAPRGCQPEGFAFSFFQLKKTQDPDLLNYRESHPEPVAADVVVRVVAVPGSRTAEVRVVVPAAATIHAVQARPSPLGICYG